MNAFRPHPSSHLRHLAGVVVVFASVAGCRSPEEHYRRTEEQAMRTVAEIQTRQYGASTPFVVERPEDTLRRRLLLDQQLPTFLATQAVAVSTTPLRLTLVDALRAGAANNNDQQARKEVFFRAALQLDLERHAFDWSWAGILTGEAQSDRSGEEEVRGVRAQETAGAQRLLRAGATVGGQIAVDLVKLLTLERPSSLGVVVDFAATVPLLRGAGRDVVMEPMTQAERNALYALLEFDRARQVYAVQVAEYYLGTAERYQRIRNASDSHERLVASRKLAQSLAEAGRLPETQVDQARQDELRARERVLLARQSYERELDRLKTLLGLPVDAAVEIDETELQRISDAVAIVAPEQEEATGDHEGTGEAGPLELPARRAIDIALAHRQDLVIAVGQLQDARRQTGVAANALRGGLDLEVDATLGSPRSYGSAGKDDASLDPSEGVYRARLVSRWPWERAAERKAYRESLIAVDRAVRAVERLEDEIKAQVRDHLRTLALARESYLIQRRALTVARRRVESADLNLQAGRAQIRDVLEAQESLLNARNAVITTTMTYRLSELSLQRDLAVLSINEEGLWHEVDLE